MALCQAGKLFREIVPTAPIANEFHPSPFTVVTPPPISLLGNQAVNLFTTGVPSVELQAPNPSFRTQQGFKSYGPPTTADRTTKFAPNTGNEILSAQIPNTPNLPSLPSVPILSNVLSLPNLSDSPGLTILPDRPSVPARPSVPISHILSQPSRPHSAETISLPVNSLVSIIDDKNQYTNGFSLDDGTKVAEQGKLISTDDGWEYVIAKKGSYEYVSPDGTPIKVKWIADENGFRHV